MNEDIKRFVERAMDDCIPMSTSEEEIDKRLFDVKTGLGMLEQMLKMPDPHGKLHRLHKMHIIHTMILDLFGIKGEKITL